MLIVGNSRLTREIYLTPSHRLHILLLVKDQEVYSIEEIHQTSVLQSDHTRMGETQPTCTLVVVLMEVIDHILSQLEGRPP
jgi:hypothetical protein